MDLGDLSKVWEIKTLKRAGEDDARKMLDKIAKQVQPIMRRHNWRVKLLSEFWPKTPALLGLNIGGGVHIKLRIRRHNRDWDFLPYEEVLDTMLHELCHNVHAPHNASFYKLWDEIRKECEELVSKGISGTGQGFDLPGRTLGGFSHKISIREASVAAARKRSRLGVLLPSGAQYVGGNNSIKALLTPSQASAMAAERRLRDNIWCGSEFHDEAGSSLNITGTLENSSLEDPRSMNMTGEEGQSSSSATEQQKHSDARELWECGMCTLLNPPLAPVCQICDAQKPLDSGVRYRYWTCKFCTLQNLVKSDKCLACDQWRYSRGPPVSTSAVYSGT